MAKNKVSDLTGPKASEKELTEMASASVEIARTMRLLAERIEETCPCLGPAEAPQMATLADAVRLLAELIDRIQEIGASRRLDAHTYRTLGRAYEDIAVILGDAAGQAGDRHAGDQDGAVELGVTVGMLGAATRRAAMVLGH